MSWEIYLEKNGETVVVERHVEGGTFAVGGSVNANLNVTYNYSEVTRLVSFYFNESLNGKVARDTIADLERVIDRLGKKQYQDYWAPTPGNAGHAANILLQWAKQHPDAVWRVS